MAPYWIKQAKFAADHGVKVAIEMHPGFVVYSPETMLKLRAIAGPVRRLQLRSQPHVLAGHRSHRRHPRPGRLPSSTSTPRTPRSTNATCRMTGVLDTKNYTDERNRAWIFRTCGYGHGDEWWNEFVSTLRMFGYDYVLSIEHEDSLLSPEEGLSQGRRLPERPGDPGAARRRLVGVGGSCQSENGFRTD